MFFTYWFLPGFVSCLLLHFYFFWIPIDSRQLSLKERLDSYTDYRFWIIISICGLFGLITLLISISALALSICGEIRGTRTRREEFLNKTPWYQQKEFGGWKTHNSEKENDNET